VALAVPLLLYRPKRIVLIAKQTLSSSAVLDGFGPDVHHLPAYERLDSFRAILGKKP
jgi:hypothetical protein